MVIACTVQFICKVYKTKRSSHIFDLRWEREIRKSLHWGREIKSWKPLVDMETVNYKINVMRRVRVYLTGASVSPAANNTRRDNI